MDRRELVEKMVGVYEESGRRAGLDPAEERFFDERRKAMDAALSVSVDELLKPLAGEMVIIPPGETFRDGFEAVLASRRAKLERVKTATELIEEYVTKHQVTSPLVSRFQIASEILALLEKK